MASGRKTELVAVERETKTADGGGGYASAWASIGTIWAEVKWVRGGESERQGSVRAVNVYKFVALSAAVEEIGVLPTDRLVWLGDRYNIRERPRRLERQPDCEIVAETGVTQ